MFITISTEYHPCQCHFELFGQLIPVGEISLKIYKFLQISNFTALSTDWATNIDYCFLCSPGADKRFWTIQFLITPSSCSVPYQRSYRPCQCHFELFGQLIPIGEISLKIYRFLQISIFTALSTDWATDIDYCFLCFQMLIKDYELYSFWSHHLVAQCHINGATALVNAILNFLVNLSNWRNIAQNLQISTKLDIHCSINSLSYWYWLLFSLFSRCR
jgi:hypothetical protein